MNSIDASFTDILDRFALPKGYVLDGVPRLARADMQFEGPLKGALDACAARYGYTWRLSKGGSVLLTKHLRDLADRPQTNVGEMRRTAKDILTVIRSVPFAENDDFDQYLAALGRTLSPEQRMVLQAGGTLRGDTLAPDQQNLLRLAIFTNTFARDCSAWALLADQLERIDEASVRVVERRGSDTQARPLGVVLSCPVVDGKWLDTWIYPLELYRDYHRNYLWSRP